MKLLKCLLIFLLSGCAKKIDKKEISYLIADNNYKYWDVIKLPKVYDKNKAKYFPVYCYYFNKNGDYHFCEYDYHRKIREIHSTDDVLYSDSWKGASDTIIYINEQKTKIERIDEDTLIIRTNSGDEVVLSSSKVRGFSNCPPLTSHGNDRLF